MKLTDEQRSMIASLVVHAGDSTDELGIDILCLCCSGWLSLELAEDIVGDRHAPALVSFVREALGCGWRDADRSRLVEAAIEQAHLDKISELEDLDGYPLE